MEAVEVPFQYRIIVQNAVEKGKRVWGGVSPGKFPPQLCIIRSTLLHLCRVIDGDVICFVFLGRNGEDDEVELSLYNKKIIQHFTFILRINASQNLLLLLKSSYFSYTLLCDIVKEFNKSSMGVYESETEFFTINPPIFVQGGGRRDKKQKAHT